MDLRKLRYFAGVVEAKSISRAAHALNVAQPALSKSIQALELDLGTPLLQRSRQGVTTTEAGDRLYDHCQILFKQVERARSDIRRSVGDPSGRVVVGMPHSLASVIALPLLQAMTKRYPEVRLELRQDQSHFLAVDLRANKLDFAVIASPRSRSGLFCFPLLVEELMFITSRNDGPNDSKPTISFEDASRRQFVLPSMGNGLRACAEGHFRARSLPLEVKYEIDAIALMTQCVLAGLGASLLPGGCLERDANYARTRVRAFAEGGCHRGIVLCHAEEATMSPAAACTISMIEEIVKEMVNKGSWLGARLP
ncbi:MAG: LysR family transcriptional regulator [Bauldia sp.]|nr:LysR family transcriptional regulator [Bauldia sp.]